MSATALIDPLTLDGSELYVDAGLPGFPSVHRFRLEPWGDRDGPFSVLTCLDLDGLAFVVVRPELFFADYTAEVDRASAERLGLADPQDAVVYVIVTVGSEPADATVNLLGPLVVNRRNLRAAQVVLDDHRWSVRTPLVTS